MAEQTFLFNIKTDEQQSDIMQQKVMTMTWLTIKDKKNKGKDVAVFTLLH